MIRVVDEKWYPGVLLDYSVRFLMLSLLRRVRCGSVRSPIEVQVPKNGTCFSDVQSSNRSSFRYTPTQGQGFRRHQCKCGKVTFCRGRKGPLSDTSDLVDR